MKVTNTHTRTLPYPKEKVAQLFLTLATQSDMIWPVGKWPRMKFNDGLRKEAHGGHGPIQYFVEEIIPGEKIVFRFTQPKGFIGTHTFYIEENEKFHTEVKHVIEMHTSLLASIQWALVIRWLHDALLEDAFDRMEENLGSKAQETPWNAWVKFLRFILK